MEQIRCDTCGQDRPRPRPDLTQSLSLRSPFAVVECTRCGLRYMNPRLTADEYRDFYAGPEYLAEYGYDDLLAASRLPEFQRTLRRIAARCAPSGRLLDIGTATGEFLVEARKQGWAVFGTEVSDSSVKMAKKKYGLELFHGELDSASFPERSFDVVHLSHVLEHVPSPQKTLKDIQRFLAPNGWLVIEVPNEFENWFLRVGKILHRYQPPTQPSMHHVYFFTPATLGASLRTAGYQAEVSTYSPALPVAHPPAWLRAPLHLMTRLVDGWGGGIHIQALAQIRKSSR